MNASFPRSCRLLNGAEYSEVFQHNTRVSDRYWMILAHCGNQLENRLGLAIAKKRARRAVDRNRIKRLAREYFRLHRHQLSGVHLVVLNRDATVGATNQELRKSLDALWQKLVIKCKS